MVQDAIETIYYIVERVYLTQGYFRYASLAIYETCTQR